MQNRFWQVVARRCLRVWRQTFGRTKHTGVPVHDGDPSGAARARFWADFREGQREAEIRANRLP